MSETLTGTTKREIEFWWPAICIVVGTLSVISFVQKVTQVGLAPVPNMVL
jgi:hypothetical protein